MHGQATCQIFLPWALAANVYIISGNTLKPKWTSKKLV